MIKVLLIILSFSFCSGMSNSSIQHHKRGSNFLLTFKHCGEYTNVIFSDSGNVYVQDVDFTRVNHQQEVAEFITEFNPDRVTEAFVRCEH